MVFAIYGVVLKCSIEPSECHMHLMLMLILILLSFNASALDKDCPEGTYRRRAHSRGAYYTSNGVFHKATSVRESKCIPKRAGHDFWINRLKNGSPPNWPLKEGGAKWTEEQRDRVLEALSDLPEILWIQSIKGVYRLSRSKDHPIQRLMHPA